MEDMNKLNEKKQKEVVKQLTDQDLIDYHSDEMMEYLKYRYAARQNLKYANIAKAEIKRRGLTPNTFSE